MLIKQFVSGLSEQFARKVRMASTAVKIWCLMSETYLNREGPSLHSMKVQYNCLGLYL